MRKIFLFLLAFFILPVSAAEERAYPLPEDFLGLWEVYSDDVPHSYRFNPDGTINEISEHENVTTHYKFIFQDENGKAYLLWRYRNEKVFIAAFEIRPAVYYRPLLLRKMSSHCRITQADWDNPPISQMKADILVKTVEPYDQDCMDFGSRTYYRRP